MSEEAFAIRRYERGDLDAVLELHELGLHEMRVHAGPGPWDDDLRDIHAAYIDSGGEFLVGLVAETVVAMGALRPTSPGRVEVKRMRVHADYRRRGFGERILTGLVDHARRAGFRVVHLDTTMKQDAARALYLKNGFVEVSRGPWQDTEIVYYEKALELPR